MFWEGQEMTEETLHQRITKRLIKQQKKSPRFSLDDMWSMFRGQRCLTKDDYGSWLGAVESNLIPANATIRREYIKSKEGKERGPYIYAYWKEGKKLRKKYIGKSFEANHFRKVFLKPYEMTAGEFQKWEFLKKRVEEGNNELAKEYWERFNDRSNRKQVSLDWAYRVVSKNLSHESSIKTGFREL